MGYKSKFTGEQVDALLEKAGQGGGGSASKWTGHADVEGLKAIGWTDEDIAYYQEHGVNWNAEDDEYHKVSEDNKALYGVLTAENISEYADRIVYLPKIDTSDMIRIVVKGNCMKPRNIESGAQLLVKKIDTTKAIDRQIKQGDILLIHLNDTGVYKIRIFDKYEGADLVTYRYDDNMHSMADLFNKAADEYLKKQEENGGKDNGK